MKNHNFLFFFAFILSSCVGNIQNMRSDDRINQNQVKDTAEIPHGITRNIKQDSEGRIWVATFDGIFRFDGKSFSKITDKINSVRFFSVLEDRKGNFWFSSVGSGVYYYDGESFTNYTSKDGLANNRVTEIYEDSKGNIWFSTEQGASRFDGKSFLNFTTENGLPANYIHWILEDQSGKFWFGTQEGVSIYDGKSFFNLNQNNRAFYNVRSMIEDASGNIWIGGNDGLWKYDGRNFTKFSDSFVGYIYEDKEGNIWTSSKDDKTSEFSNGLQKNGNQESWVLSRYNKSSLSNPNLLPELIKTHEGMIFGILEANDGIIWYGTLNGIGRWSED